MQARRASYEHVIRETLREFEAGSFRMVACPIGRVEPRPMILSPSRRPGASVKRSKRASMFLSGSPPNSPEHWRKWFRPKWRFRPP